MVTGNHRPALQTMRVPPLELRAPWKLSELPAQDSPCRLLGML